MVYQWFDTSLCITLIPWTKAFVRHHLAFIGTGISGHWGKIQRDVVSVRYVRDNPQVCLVCGI